MTSPPYIAEVLFTYGIPHPASDHLPLTKQEAETWCEKIIGGPMIRHGRDYRIIHTFLRAHSPTEGEVMAVAELVTHL